MATLTTHRRSTPPQADGNAFDQEQLAITDRRLAATSTTRSGSTASRHCAALTTCGAKTVAASSRQQRKAAPSIAIADGCDLVLQGERNIMVECRHLREGQQIAKLSEKNLAETVREKYRHSDKKQTYNSIVSDCRITMQGRDSVYATVKDSSQGTRPRRHSHAAGTDATQPVSRAKYNAVREKALRANADCFVATNCRTVFCGDALKVIRVRDNVVLGKKQPAKPKRQSYNVKFDHIQKAEGVVHQADEAFGGVHLTRVELATKDDA